MTQKKKYKKALKKIMKLAEMPTSETPQQRIKRLKGIAEKALFIPDVVGRSEQFSLDDMKQAYNAGENNAGSYTYPPFEEWFKKR